MVLTQSPKRRTPIHEKKRHGQHHKQTHHYGKTYWPYLPLLLIVALGLSVNGWLGHRQQVLGAQSDISSVTLAEETNAIRTKNQEQTLVLNDSLSAAAQAKAADMVAKNYWSHNAPDGKTPWSFIQQSGYTYESAGENLAYGFSSSDAVLSGWMNSSEHRANILRAAYQQVGFGIVRSQNYQGRGPQTVVVALYATPRTAATPASQAVLGEQTQAALPASKHVARVQLLTAGSAPWSLLIVSFIAGAALVFVVVRHGLLLKRAFAKSEAFIIKHPMLDITIVALGMLSFILSRTTGFIQ